MGDKQSFAPSISHLRCFSKPSTRFFYSQKEARWHTLEKVRETPPCYGKAADSITAGKSSKTLLIYFDKNGAPCEEDANPAEHMVEVIQGNTDDPVDWVDVWNRSPERQKALDTLHQLNSEASATAGGAPEDGSSFATSKFFQWKMVLHRQMIQLWRSPVCPC